MVMRSGVETLRDARYVVPFTVLVGVIVLSAALAGVQPAHMAPGLAASAPDTATNVSAPTQPALSPADARRTADLATLSDLLETYRSRNGTYPSTEGYTLTLCATAWDPGCLLASLSSHLPASDGTHPYWYRSDGASYTIFALVDASPNQADCPAPLPPALSGGPILCMNSPGGVHR
jgi:hypothetical protein